MNDKEKQFKERIKCGIAYCENTAINEKQIEMINDLRKIHSMPIPMLKGLDAWSPEIAEELIKLGWVKLPENAVVLTREEWARLRNLEINYEDMHEHYRELSLEHNSLKDKIVISKKVFYENYVLIDELLIKEGLVEHLRKVASAQEKKIKLLEQELVQARKETAREIVTDLKNSGEIKALLEMETMPKVFKDIYNCIVRRIDELAKQFGVEIKE